MKKINIGVLGAGHVGAQLIQNLLYQPELFVVKRVAVLNLQKHRNFNISLIEITTNILDVIEDPNIDVIVDCLPGAELPQQAMIKSLHWNKMIVSCGKEV
jgi:homoserine dehydrogenase